MKHSLNGHHSNFLKNNYVKNALSSPKAKKPGNETTDSEYVAVRTEAADARRTKQSCEVPCTTRHTSLAHCDPPSPPLLHHFPGQTHGPSCHCSHSVASGCPAGAEKGGSCCYLTQTEWMSVYIMRAFILKSTVHGGCMYLREVHCLNNMLVLVGGHLVPRLGIPQFPVTQAVRVVGHMNH